MKRNYCYREDRYFCVGMKIGKRQINENDGVSGVFFCSCAALVQGNICDQYLLPARLAVSGFLRHILYQRAVYAAVYAQWERKKMMNANPALQAVFVI